MQVLNEHPSVAWTTSERYWSGGRMPTGLYTTAKRLASARAAAASNRAASASSARASCATTASTALVHRHDPLHGSSVVARDRRGRIDHASAASPSSSTRARSLAGPALLQHLPAQPAPPRHLVVVHAVEPAAAVPRHDVRLVHADGQRMRLQADDVCRGAVVGVKDHARDSGLGARDSGFDQKRESSTATELDGRRRSYRGVYSLGRCLDSASQWCDTDRPHHPRHCMPPCAIAPSSSTPGA